MRVTSAMNSATIVSTETRCDDEAAVVLDIAVSAA